MARASQRAYYRLRQRCPWCGKPCQGQRRHCARCLAWNRAYQRARYNRLRQAGVCVQCAHEEAPPPYARCSTCRAYMRAYHRS